MYNMSQNNSKGTVLLLKMSWALTINNSAPNLANDILSLSGHSHAGDDSVYRVRNSKLRPNDPRNRNIICF